MYGFSASNDPSGSYAKMYCVEPAFAQGSGNVKLTTDAGYRSAKDRYYPSENGKKRTFWDRLVGRNK